MLKKFALSAVAVFGLMFLANPPKANAGVHFGVAIGGPVYTAPAPVYTYPSPYYGYPGYYGYGYVAPPVYSYPYGYGFGYFGGREFEHRDFDHGFRGGERFRGGEGFHGHDGGHHR